MRCLTDLRLTLAARLGVTADDEEFWASLPEDDERLPVYEIYGWLGYLLESLLDAASPLKLASSSRLSQDVDG